MSAKRSRRLSTDDFSVDSEAFVENSSLRLEVEALNVQISNLNREISSLNEGASSHKREMAIVLRDLELLKEKLGEQQRLNRELEGRYSDQIFQLESNLLKETSDRRNIAVALSALERETAQKIKLLEDARLIAENESAALRETKRVESVPEISVKLGEAPIAVGETNSKIKEQEIIIKHLRNELEHCQTVLKASHSSMHRENNIEKLHEQIRELEGRLWRSESVNASAQKAEEEKTAALEALERWDEMRLRLGSDILQPEDVVQLIVNTRKDNLLLINSVGERESARIAAERLSAQVSRERDDALGKVRELEGDHRKLNEELVGWREKVKILERSVEDSKKALVALNPESAVIAHKRSEILEKEKTALRREVEALGAELAISAKKVETLEGEKQTLWARVSAEKREKDEATNLATETKLELERKKTEWKENIRALMESSKNQIVILKEILTLLGWNSKIDLPNSAITLQSVAFSELLVFLSKQISAESVWQVDVGKMDEAGQDYAILTETEEDFSIALARRLVGLADSTFEIVAIEGDAAGVKEEFGPEDDPPVE